MPLRNFFSRQLQETLTAPIDHVYNFITGAANEDTSPTIVRTSNLDTPSRKFVSKALPDSKYTSDSPTSRKNQHLDRVLEGHFGSEIVIEDEDQSPDLANHSLIPTSPSERPRDAAKQPSYVSRRPQIKNSKSDEEDWLLGNARRSPPDATKIPDPMYRFTVGARHGLGLKPVNTLNNTQTPKSSRTDFYLEQTRRDAYPHSKQYNQSRQHEHAHPRKRQRIGSSPKEEVSREIINLDDSQEFNDLGFHVKSSEGTRKHVEPQSRISEEKKNSISVKDRKRYRNHSPDDLADAETFTKNAKQERDRKERIDAELTQRKLDECLRSSPVPHISKEESHGRPRSRPINRTPNMSRMAARLAEESPDELQSDQINQRTVLGELSITPSSTTNSVSKKPRLGLSTQRNELRKIPIDEFVGHPLPQTENYVLVIDGNDQKIFIDYGINNLSEDPIGPFISLDKINRVMWSNDGQCLIVQLSLTNGVIKSNPCYINFKSEKGLRDFTLFISAHNSIKTSQKNKEWLENAMARAHAQQEQLFIDSNHNTRPGARSQRILPTTVHRDPPLKRARLIDRLDTPKEYHKTLSDTDPLGHTSVIDARTIDRPIRRTRSSASILGDEVKTNSEEPKKPSRRTEPEWKTELVYPPTGRKRETVSWHDLTRLEDDEFLNDNLVGIFFRYLQEHADQDLMKKMHFFSSFFYERLTNSTETKIARRQINHKAVASWTKHVNIFSRDFVIVPVNENLHWYVMIICNLREFKQQDPLEENEVTVIDEPSAQEIDEAILTNDIINGEDFTNNKLPSSPSSKTEVGKKGKRKSVKPPHRKYDVKSPVIITLDSLNAGRSATATALKQYVIEESKGKPGIDVELSDIQGMTAKGIPLQPNYSDCGLYMCMYMEQFMRDPYGFVRKILQREDSGPRWPKKIESSDLRQRFYNMLQELYAAQQGRTSAKISDIGNILVTMNVDEESDFEEIERPRMTAADVRSGADFYHKYKASQDRIYPVEDEQELDGQHFKDMDVPTIVNDDTSQHRRSRTKSASPSKSPYFPTLPPKTVSLHSPRFGSPVKGDPSSLAKSLMERRNSSKMGHSPELPDDEREISGRSISVNTDYLSGSHSYQSAPLQKADPELEKTWNGFADDEVAETQNSDGKDDMEMLLH